MSGIKINDFAMIISNYAFYCCFFILVDIDECQSSGACRSDLVCNNTVGSYRCECPVGFVVDPSSQNVMDPVCVGEEVNL